MPSCITAALLLLAVVVPLTWGAITPTPSATNHTPSNHTLQTKWTVQVPSTAQVALVWQDIVYLSYQNADYNMIQAATANQSSLWTTTSVGPVPSPTGVYAFPSIPSLIFLVGNNIQPPNVSAVVPTTGAVVWSTPGSFETQEGFADLSSSVDGSTLYLLTPDVYGNDGMRVTAIDAGSGAVLFVASNLSWGTTAQCGASSVGCVVNVTDIEGLVFLDGRTGVPVGSVQVPAGRFIVVAQSLLLTITGSILYMVNTTNFTVAWSKPITVWWRTKLQSWPVGSGVELALIVSDSSSSFASLDAVTGRLIWNTTATTICPSTSPAPGYANGFYYGEYEIGPNLETKFPFYATCAYPDGTQLTIFGWINNTNGAVVDRGYLPYLPGGPPFPIGASSLVMPGRWAGESDSDYFYSDDLTAVGMFPPRGWCTVFEFSAYPQGRDAIFILSCWQYSQVTAITVV